MSLHCFSIPALLPEPSQTEFNQFCAAQRVLRIERQFVPDGPNAYWALCVEVADGAGPLPDALKRSGRRSGAAPAPDAAAAARPDYKQTLSEADFEVFVALRHWRKAQGEAEGLPLYAVFTNEQLAAIAQQRCASLADLGAVDGVGPARVQRYGAAVLQCVARVGGPGAAPHATPPPGPPPPASPMPDEPPAA